MNADQTKILTYLRDKIRQGKRYFKARQIGEDLGLSSRTVGADMARLATFCKDLRITRWAYSNSTTWLVTKC